MTLKGKHEDGPSILLPHWYCLPAVNFLTTMSPLILIAVCKVQCFIFLPTWASCRMHTPYSSLNSYCCENKSVFLFCPLLTVYLMEQQFFLSCWTLLKLNPVRGSACYKSGVYLCITPCIFVYHRLDLENANTFKPTNGLIRTHAL